VIGHIQSIGIRVRGKHKNRTKIGIVHGVFHFNRHWVNNCVSPLICMDDEDKLNTAMNACETVARPSLREEKILANNPQNVAMSMPESRLGHVVHLNKRTIALRSRSVPSQTAVVNRGVYTG